MKVKSLGHVVLKVRKLTVSVPFYRDILGLSEVARYGENMVFFSLGLSHHDLALMEIGSESPNPPAGSVGLFHVAFKIGDRLEDLQAMKLHLERNRILLAGMSDHKVSQSIYIRDPDGIEIELYVDADPKIWRDNPQAVATVKRLDLYVEYPED